MIQMFIEKTEIEDTFAVCGSTLQNNIYSSLGRMSQMLVYFNANTLTNSAHVMPVAIPTF